MPDLLCSHSECLLADQSAGNVESSAQSQLPYRPARIPSLAAALPHPEDLQQEEEQVDDIQINADRQKDGITFAGGARSCDSLHVQRDESGEEEGSDYRDGELERR